MTTCNVCKAEFYTDCTVYMGHAVHRLESCRDVLAASVVGLTRERDEARRCRDARAAAHEVELARARDAGRDTGVRACIAIVDGHDYFVSNEALRVEMLKVLVGATVVGALRDMRPVADGHPGEIDVVLGGHSHRFVPTSIYNAKAQWLAAAERVIEALREAVLGSYVRENGQQVVLPRGDWLRILANLDALDAAAPSRAGDDS